jgi:hypothetical protein
MAGRLDGEPGAAADSGTEEHEQLSDDRDGVGLRVRSDPGDNLAEQLVIDTIGAGAADQPAVGRSSAVSAGLGLPGGPGSDSVIRRRARRLQARGGLVNDRLPRGECGDRRGDGEVVRLPGQAAGDLVDQRDCVSVR